MSETTEQIEDKKIDWFAENSRKTKQTTIEQCPLLFSSAHNDKDGTLCFGWECDYGWFDHISRLSYEIETLNSLFYPIYGVKVVVQQIKEKYGSLRYYCDTVVDPKPLFRFPYQSLNRLSEYIGKKYNFDFKKVYKIPRHNIFLATTVSKEAYESNVNHGISSRSYVTVGNNEKYIQISMAASYGESSYVCQNHKLMYLVKKTVDFISAFFNKIATRTISDKQYQVSNVLSTLVGKIVSEYEKKSEYICEQCGKQLTDTTMCSTYGYIRSLCQKCADESGSRYAMNGNVYQKGEFIEKVDTDYADAK